MCEKEIYAANIEDLFEENKSHDMQMYCLSKWNNFKTTNNDYLFFLCETEKIYSFRF